MTKKTDYSFSHKVYVMQDNGHEFKKHEIGVGIMGEKTLIVRLFAYPKSGELIILEDLD